MDQVTPLPPWAVFIFHGNMGAGLLSDLVLLGWFQVERFIFQIMSHFGRSQLLSSGWYWGLPIRSDLHFPAFLLTCSRLNTGHQYFTHVLRMPPVFSFLYGTTLLSPAEILLMLNFPLVSKVVWNLLSEADIQYSKRCSQRRWAIFPLKQVIEHLSPSLNQNKVKLSKSEHLSLHVSENLELEAWPIVVLIRMSQS